MYPKEKTRISGLRKFTPVPHFTNNLKKQLNKDKELSHAKHEPTFRYTTDE
ncbi:MAG: hypothetical protein LIP05_14760 [Tannerellaceae bacterium]|nr:hypothetical protein [Tannerellaceae bacterium]